MCGIINHFPWFLVISITYTQSIVRKASLEEEASEDASPRGDSVLSGPSSFEGHVTSCSATERALLLAFALRWRHELGSLSSDKAKEYEREIWLSHIHAIIENMEATVRNAAL